jgi:hypothetical protein
MENLSKTDSFDKITCFIVGNCLVSRLDVEFYQEGQLVGLTIL